MNETAPHPLSERNEAMDAARGLAVFGMIFMHLVPLQGWPLIMGEGVAAALFFVLAGMAWGIQADRHSNALKFWAYWARRGLALIALGIVLHLTIWPTEVLIAIGIFILPAIAIKRVPPSLTLFSIGLTMIVTVVCARYFLEWSAQDWFENGAHQADKQLGWVTVRFLLFDGNYPLLPWLAFPLYGLLLSKPGSKGIGRSHFFVGLSITIAMMVLTIWTTQNEATLGDMAPYLATTWVPTTIPFLLMKAGFATSIIAGLSLWKPKIHAVVTCLGRMSLTHYFGHICLVFAPLRFIFPHEDWTTSVGVTAFTLYLVVAIPTSIFWLRVHGRGPLEQLLAILSGNFGSSKPAAVGSI